MSNALMIPSIAFAAYGTKTFLDQNVFAFGNRAQMTASSFFGRESSRVEAAVLHIIKGVVASFFVGAALTAVPAILFTASPEVCIILGARICSTIGLVKAAIFLNSTIGFDEPFGSFLSEAGKYI